MNVLLVVGIIKSKNYFGSDFRLLQKSPNLFFLINTKGRFNSELLKYEFLLLFNQINLKIIQNFVKLLTRHRLMAGRIVSRQEAGDKEHEICVGEPRGGQDDQCNTISVEGTNTVCVQKFVRSGCRTQ